MSQDSAFDASIPVLTEVVTEPAAPAQEAAGEQLERRATERWTGEEWSVLERRVTERVLQQLQGRVDFVLEQRVRDAMADAMQRTLEVFTADLRAGLHEALGDIVRQAFAKELEYLQTRVVGSADRAFNSL
ncbi:hypothetical protein [Massilia yuzhufengensis]|uniref:Uncharacterized protein n=1 Tax=Massilia yuzhufengensis TaxID=1164594 RepID=A0A1I1I4N0_9BURK|nr:hypothetical protein [Massilia yuzhufengensis]SFC31041.1 hypothetical protein SAMN05216204_10582 [Massilia yuzhufengensis]